MPEDVVRQAALMLSAAKLIEQGCKVFHCGPNKAPLTRKGFKAATADIETISRWLAKDPTAMLAVATGRVSGVFVVDLDVSVAKGLDGLKWWTQNENYYGLTAPHAVARTPRGGRHHYFRYPDSRHIACSAGKLAPGVDVRGDGGYVIVPPSASAAGEYSWEIAPWEVPHVV